LARWKDAVETLAKFHRLNPTALGLGNFGRHSGFYNRQIATFKTLSKVQAKAVDVETKVPVGELPHFDEIMDFFSDEALQPKDRASFVHGDYKIDNMVFHKTEPRVIGVLDWEMATIGHPLSDLCNLTGPYTALGAGSSPDILPFDPKLTPGLPTREQCIQWYIEVAGWDPRPDLLWGDAFHGFRGSVIMQGIAARYALQAKEYGEKMYPFALQSWKRVEKMLEESKRRKSKI
jgi:aminoglycoside phosphotransferase (APT) family kinase protein